MASTMPHSQAAVRRIIALAIVILAIVVAGGVGILTFAVVSADRAQVSEEESLVARRVDHAQDAIVQQVKSEAIWDEGYEKIGTARVDLVWADTNTGRHYIYDLGHDTAMVLNGADQPIYAWKGSGRAQPAQVAPLVKAISPMLQELREQEGVDRRLASVVQSYGRQNSVSRSGLAVVDGSVYVVAASTITPETYARPHGDLPANVLISAQRLDGALLSDIQDDLHLTGAHLVSVHEHATASTPVVDVNGYVARQIAWTPKRPGMAVLKRAAPVLTLVALALLTAGMALAARISAIVRELAAGDGALERTMGELVRAKDLADTANVAKSQFLANMSHEIRTPLNGILGMAQVMARSELTPAQRERLNVIRDSGQTLLAVLNDVLDFSKIEAGRLEIDSHEFDVTEAIEGVCAAFTTLAAQKDVALRTEIEPESEGVWFGDGARLKQVIANLVSNAVKFTSDGEVFVHVEPAAFGLRFTVRDSGIGIPPERLGDLFQKFSQVDASTTRRFGGTGLGLAISRELVELMGGRMSVTSEVGRGSTFTFDLPLEKRAERRAPSAAAVERDPSDEGPAARILAAEDNPTNQLILKSLLEPLGVDLTLVANGREAVEASAAGGFDLILMDVQMPEMNGIEATQAIRAREAAQHAAPIPILALSANVMSHQVKEYYEVGMTGFIPKPIEAAKLFDAINEALAEADAADGQSTQAA